MNATRASRSGLAVSLVAGLVAGFLGSRLMPERSAASPVASAPADTSPVVARVGDETVTLAEFDERWRQLDGAAQSFHGAMARGAGLASGREHFLGELVDELLLAREAHRRGLDERADIRAAVRAARNRITSRPLLAREVRDAALPRSEVEAWYREHADRFGEPARVRIAEIVVTSAVSGPRDDTPDAASARRKADALHARAVAGEDFATLARQGSEAVSAQYGGLVGWVTAGRFARPWEEQALALQPGEISGVIEIPEGFVFLVATEVQPSTVPPLEQVEDRIVEELLVDDQGAMQRRYNVFVGELREREKPESRPDLVRQDAPLPPPETAPGASPSESAASGPSGG